MSDRNDTERGGWPWLKIVLGLSLALNLAVAGLVAGAFLRHRGGHHGGETVGASLFRDMPREDRKALWRSMRHDDRRAGRQDRRDIAALLRATPFDAEAMRTLLEKRGKAHADRLSRLQGLWIERVSAMTDAKRAAFADRIEKPRGKRRGSTRREAGD